MLKKVLSSVLAAVMTLSAVSPLACFAQEGETDGKVVFDDIVGHWARKEIEYMEKAGLVSGVSEKEFAPDKTLTKAELIALITRLLNLEEDFYTPKYSDVSRIDDWFAGNLGAAINAGIIENSVQSFIPYGKVSRSETAVYLSRALDYLGVDVTEDAERAEYSDIANVSEEESAAIAVAYDAGLMVGETATEFEPEGSLTRAEGTVIVQRLSFLSSSIKEIGGDISDISENSGFTIGEESMSANTPYSYVRFDNIGLSSNINAFEAEIGAAGENIQIEIWVNSLDSLSGTKLGTLYAESTGDINSFEKQKALINTTSGNGSVYLRFLGSGSVSIKSFRFFDDSIEVPIKSYSDIENARYVSGTLTNLKYGSRVQYDNIDFGAGYDTIEIDMINSKDGDMIEIYLDNAETGMKAGVVETAAAGTEVVTMKATLAKARDTHNIILAPVMPTEGNIKAIRFKNNTGPAEIHLEAEDAVTELEFGNCSDFNKTLQTEAMKDGDVLKFDNVDLADGFNYIDVRIENDTYNNLPLFMGSNGTTDVSFMQIATEKPADKNGYLEVRLDSETGPLTGIVKLNPVEGVDYYDTQSGELVGANGLHDVYIKAVGDIGWKVNWIKFKRQGYYDVPLVKLEAEDAKVYNAYTTDPTDPDRFKPNTHENESSGRRNVKIDKSDAYIDFTVPEWFEGGKNVAVTVRHSIPDAFTEEDYSFGQTGEMEIYVNGTKKQVREPFGGSPYRENIKLSNEYVYGYAKGSTEDSKPVAGQYMFKAAIASFFFDDATYVVEGNIKAGDVIRLKPKLDENITYCYVDFIELEKIPEPKTQPEGFLSITDFGAVSNDGLDDGAALRAAIEAVKAEPDKYAGVWIPEGLFEIKTFQDVWHGAYVAETRLVGSGMWHSRIIADVPPGYKGQTHCFELGERTLLWDFAFFGTSRHRSFNDGYASQAMSGFKSNQGFNAKGLWLEHWGAFIWGHNVTGVISENRIKNGWSDAITLVSKVGLPVDGAVVEKNLIRCTCDDAVAGFAPVSTGYITFIQYYTIRYNSISMINWGNSVALWGVQHARVENNFMADPAFFAGLAFNGDNSLNANRGEEDVVAKNNRMVRCGGMGSYHTNGAICINPSWNGNGEYSTGIKKVYIEKNDILESPLEFVYMWGPEITDEATPDLRYNYLRHVGLYVPGKENLVHYDTAHLTGNMKYSYNILESRLETALCSKTQKMKDTKIGNYPNNWKTEEE